MNIRGGIFTPALGRNQTFCQTAKNVRFVYKSNICFAPGWGHCLKNLAHSSLIEGNVISNAGLDGQVITSPNGAVLGERTYTGGMHPLDLYGCTESVVRDNTFVYRTTNNIRTIMSFRARRAWGGCNKGRRLAEDRWELLRPTNPAYQDPIFWADVELARPLFDEGYEAAWEDELLFTHKVENNRFIVLLAFKPDTVGIDRVSVARLKSLRPVADNPTRDALIAEAKGLAEACANDAACFYEGASEGLQYAYDHFPPDNQRGLVKIGKVPNTVPIPAPEGWAERYAVYWGAQEAWVCDGEGVNCAPWDAPSTARPGGELGS